MSMASVLKNCCNGARGIAKAVLAPVESPVRSSRLKTCAECIKKPVTAHVKCPECGCFVLLKIRVKDETCPLAKWEKPQP